MSRALGNRSIRISIALLLAATVVAVGEAAGPFHNPLKSRTSVEDLAEKIDKLERALQYSGRVTVKAPDVWGQARLTAHREEFEQQMAARINDFQPTINAQIATSDQAFLSQALALSATLATGQPLVPPTNEFAVIQTLTPNPGTANADGSSTVITRTGPFSATGPTAQFGAKDIILEPEILLDQRKRFLDHLHEIRRINEGDDSADAPGYSLNLVRVPVSILPGDKTRENFGAEVTLIAESVVTEELLPSTFRELVINDLIDQLSMPMVKMIDERWADFLKVDHVLSLLEASQSMNHSPGAAAPAVGAPPVDNPNDVPPPAASPISFRVYSNESPAPSPLPGPEALRSVVNKLGSPSATQTTRDTIDELIQQLEKDGGEGFRELTPAERKKAYSAIIGLFLGASRTMQVAVSRDRRSAYPIAPSQMRNVFGEYEIAILALGVFRGRDRWQCRDRASLPDVQAILRNELEYAYQMLQTVPVRTCDQNGYQVEIEGVWNSHLMINANDVRQPLVCKQKREAYFLALPLPPDAIVLGDEVDSQRTTPRGAKPTEILGWAILVESALLNAHLNYDLQQVSKDPECECVPANGQEYQFYGSNPSPEARHAFVEYVKCRWPIRVFALDPVTQQQNVADSFSLRRESQMALALAFSTGKVNAQSMSRYMRRIEQDIRTISLNNTHVGFGAGDDTFGWRFFPRVQTPDVESNFKTITRDLVIGGPSRDQREKRWRMEPGMRECVALVVMPSFVKHIRFDVRTTWFHLVPGSFEVALKNPQTGPTMESTVEWSEKIRSIEDSVLTCVKDEHKYRTGEVERLVKRAQQISRQLPLNTMFAQVPYENTLGGFEMFSSGVTDLAPELIGFYGTPGVNLDRPTTLFLVGDNFSVHATRVIAGNVPIETRMLSREVMEVQIPRNVNVVHRKCLPSADFIPCATGDCPDQYVEVRLATPYGVANPLYIPLLPPPPKAEPAPKPIPSPEFLSWSDLKYKATYRPTITAPLNVPAVSIDLASIKAAPPHQFVLLSPAGSALKAKAGGQIIIRIEGAEMPGSEIPISPGTVLATVAAQASDKGDQIVIDGDAFKAIHANMKETVRNLLNPGDTTTWPHSVKLKLSAQFVSSDGNINVRSMELLIVTLSIVRP